MLNPQKDKGNNQDASENVDIEFSIPFELQCPNECPNCKSCSETCPFKQPLDENGKKTSTYKRYTHDPFTGNREIDAVIYHVKDKEGNVIILSTVRGFFPYKGQYPTYFILFCVGLIVDLNLTADDVLSVLSKYIKEKGIKDAKLPNRSTIYRWVKKYRDFTGKWNFMKRKDIFSPLDILKNACKITEEATSKVAGKIFPILHRYLQSLKKLVCFSDLVIDIDDLMESLSTC